MQFVLIIIIGAAAGFFATRLMKLQTDLVSTIALGILGAIVGGLILRFLLMMSGVVAGFIGAVLGAMLLIWLWQRFGPKRR